MTISPTQFLNAMATPGSRELHINACTVLLQHLDRVNYPVEAELRVPLASLQGGPLIIKNAVDSVSTRITVQGRVQKPDLRTIRVNRILAPDLGVLCTVDERITLTMTNDGGAVAVMIAACGEISLPQNQIAETKGPRQSRMKRWKFLLRIAHRFLPWLRGE